jgi:hypothetical protein
MVQAAGGGDTGSPQAASAIGVLSQMMDRYKQMTGTAHPIEQAHVAAQASEQANGVVAPNPQTAPLFTSPWQRADQAQGLAPAGNAMAPAGMTGTVQPGSPQYLGTPPAFAQSGMAEGSGRGFTAPQAAPTVVLNVSS